jgi:peptide/nickel transport system permease protein
MSWRHAGTRALVAFGTLVFVLIFNFFLFRAVGDPKKDLIRSRLSPAARQAVIRERGLDKDKLTQFRIYIEQTAQGDLGTSNNSRKAVLDELIDALPNTLLLVGIATVLSSLLGSWMGVIAAGRRGSTTDTLLTQGSLVLWSMPFFFIGILAIWLFAVKVPIFPTGLKSTPGGPTSGIDYYWDVFKHLLLPVATLTASLLAQYTVIMRTNLLDVLGEDYITTGRAIGLSRRRVMRQHAVPNALLPVVTLIALNIGVVLSGAFVIESIFSWPGIGDLTINAIADKDYPVLQGAFLLSSAAVIVANFAADMCYGYLDPRVKES